MVGTEPPFRRINARGADATPGIGEAIARNSAQVHVFGASYMQSVCPCVCRGCGSLRFIGKRDDYSGDAKADYRLHIVNWDGEVQILSAYKVRTRDTDYLACHVEQRSTAAAGRNGCCDLQEFAPFDLDSSDRADNAV